jgi:hypothetical protein
MTNALHIQDFADKCAECWLGAPNDARRKPPSALSAQGLEQLEAPHSRSVAGQDMLSLVPIDMKMGLAKLGYKPGPITFASSQFDRKGFLLMHHHMLSKAKVFLDRGPAQWPIARQLNPGGEAEVTGSSLRSPTVAAKPNAKGGQGGDKVPAPSKSGGDNPASEEPRHTQVSSPPLANSNGFEQARQAKAFDSKGSMSGSLGQTSPGDFSPKDRRAEPSDDLRLPFLDLKKVKQQTEKAGSIVSGGIALEALRLGSSAGIQAKQKAVDSRLIHTAR